MSELKPCPFCGKEQMTDEQRGDSNVPYTGGTRLCDTRGCNCVSRNWNNRPLEDALRAELKKERELSTKLYLLLVDNPDTKLLADKILIDHDKD